MTAPVRRRNPRRHAPSARRFDKVRDMRTVLISCMLIAGACGGGGSDPDARQAADAVPQRVHQVACSGGEPAVTTPGLMFSPQSTTITAGQKVHFTLGATHDLASTTPGQTFSLGFGADSCLQFDAAGTYSFKCEPHNFTGTVVVQ